MKKKVSSVLAIALAVVLCLVASGCSVNSMDIIVGKVGPEKITVRDVTLCANYMLLSQGTSRSSLAASDIAGLNASALDFAVTRQVVLQKAAKLGLYPLSADNQKLVDAGYNQLLSSLQASGKDPSSAGLTEADLKTMTTYFVVSSLLMAQTTKDVTVSDDEIKTEYDKLLASQKASYDANPTAYDSAMSDGSTVVVYRPAGYRYVKHILIAMPDDIASKISSATSSGDTNTVSALRTSGLSQIQSKAEDVLSQVQNGGDFDALMAQYGVDPGMKAEPYKTSGYQVGAKSSFVPEFLQAAMNLGKPGDISALVATDYGYHIIKYVGDVPAGAISPDQVKESLRTSVLRTKQSDAFNALIGQWKKELGAKTNASKIPS